MTTRHVSKNKKRRAGGSAIAEFGPALGIILICFFFPTIDMLAVGMSYGFVMVLNNNQVHESSLVPASNAADPSGMVKKGIPDQWKAGMGHFVNMTGSPVTDITYRDGTTEGDGVKNATVTVKTTVVCNPFLPIPLPFANVPGLNGPMTFAIQSERPMENPDDPNQ